MSVLYREILLLAAVFIAMLIFIFTHILSDLPDDFLSKVRQSVKKEEE